MCCLQGLGWHDCHRSIGPPALPLGLFFRFAFCFLFFLPSDVQQRHPAPPPSETEQHRPNFLVVRVAWVFAVLESTGKQRIGRRLPQIGVCGNFCFPLIVAKSSIGWHPVWNGKQRNATHIPGHFAVSSASPNAIRITLPIRLHHQLVPGKFPPRSSRCLA